MYIIGIDFAYNDNFKQLTNENLLSDMELDYTIFKLNHLVWTNKEELWKKWIRS